MSKRKTIIAFILITVFVFVAMVPVSMAKANGDPIMDAQLGTRDLNKKQIEELTKDIEKAKLRSKKDTDFLLDEAESQMNLVSASIPKSQVIALAGSYISIGTNATYYTSDTGNSGKTSDLVAASDSRWGPWYSDSYSGTAGIGSASSWAYNAKTINVTGSGSRNAYIRFSGNYTGWTNPGWLGGTAAARIRVSVYDLTAGSEIGGNTIKEVSDSVSSGSNFNQVPFNSSVLVSLQAGHSYLLRYGVSTSVSNYSPQSCDSDFWNDTNPGIYQNNVKVEWQ